MGPHRRLISRMGKRAIYVTRPSLPLTHLLLQAKVGQEPVWTAGYGPRYGPFPTHCCPGRNGWPLTLRFATSLLGAQLPSSLRTTDRVLACFGIRSAIGCRRPHFHSLTHLLTSQVVGQTFNRLSGSFWSCHGPILTAALSVM